MKTIYTLARRELIGLYVSPIGYLVLAVFAFVTAIFFFLQYGPGNAATMRSQFIWIVWLLVFISPAISMRSLSEEINTGTLELLMTSPISDAQVILGKWLGTLIFFITLFVPIGLQIVLLELTAQPDYGPIFTGLLGIFLVGAFYLAIGVFVSALTDSQLIAFVITTLITGSLTIGLFMLTSTSFVPLWLNDSLYYINVIQQYEAFSKGLIVVRHFTFFVSASALFLFFGVKVLESRRWR